MLTRVVIGMSGMILFVSSIAGGSLIRHCTKLSSPLLMATFATEGNATEGIETAKKSSIYTRTGDKGTTSVRMTVAI